MPGRPEMLVATDPLVDADEVLDRLKRAVFRSRVRVGDFFSDFDPLRSGLVTEAKFRTALVECGAMPLTEREMQALAAKYAGPGGRVRHRALLADLESAFTSAGMERDPAANTADFTATLASTGVRLPAEMEAASDELIEQLKHEVRVRGLEVRQPFIDHSKHVNSSRVVDQVTNEQFVTGLTQLGLSCSPADVQLLQARFAGQPGFVNYNRFACAIDPALNTFSAREPRSNLLKGSTLHSGFRVPVVLGPGPDQPGRPPPTADFPRLPLDTPAAGVGELLARLHEKTVQFRARVGEALQDHDRHNNGTVTQTQFVQALKHTFGPLRLSLSADEIRMLADRYQKTMPHGAVHVQWRLFVAEVEAGGPGGGGRLERDPLGKPEPHYLQHQPLTLPPQEEEAVQALLADMRRRVEVRRALVKPMFADYEKQVNSAKAVDHVTRSQMVQAFSRLGIDLPIQHQRLLFARYDTNRNGLVNYIALVRDIDRYESKSPRKHTQHAFPQDPDYGKLTAGVTAGGFYKPRIQPGSPQPGRPAPRNDAPGAQPAGSLGAVLARLSDAAKTHRLKTDHAFREFDLGRRNQVTQPQFVKVLDMVFGKLVPLAETDTALLLQAFATRLKGAGVGVAWRDFVAAVDNTESPAKGLQLPTLPPADEQVVAETCGRLAHLVRTRRLLLRPFFQDMEKSRRAINRVDHITRMQFAECLSSLGLDVTAAELQVLARKFDDKGDGWVNYVAFQVAIDPEQAVFLARDGHGNAEDSRLYAQTGGWRTANTVVDGQPGRPPVVAEIARLNMSKPAAGSLDELLARLRRRCSTYSINLSEFFSDFDRRRCGIVSEPQFRQALHRAFGESYIKADLSSVEVAALEHAFAARTSDGGHGVDYRRFVKEATGTPNLEQHPLLVPPAAGDDTPPLPTLTPREEAEVEAVLEQLRTRFRVRQVYVKAPFVDFARSPASPMVVAHVTRNQFVKALARHEVMLAPEQFALLAKKYDDLGDGSINYEAFCEAVDSYKSATGVKLYSGFKKERYILG